MAATADREAQRKDGRLQNYAAGAVKIFKGTLVSRRVGDGYAYPARSGTSTDVFLGVSFEYVDNSGGAAGALSLRVEKEGSYVFLQSGFAQTDIGATVYASNDNTVTKTSSNNQAVGTVTEIIDTTHCRVLINNAVK